LGIRPNPSSVFDPDIVQLVNVTWPLALVDAGPPNEPLKLDE
jgi:hypothetical protein